MSLAKKIASSTFSQVLAKFLIAGLSIISVKFITTYLGTAGYGRYAVIYEMMAFSGIVADFGFFHIALREIGKNLESVKRILSNILSMRLILSIFAALVTFGIVFFFTSYDHDTVKMGLVIALGTATIGLMGTTVTAVLQVHLRMTFAAIVQIIGKIVMIIYIWYAVQNDLGFLHMLYAGLFGSILIFLLNYAYALRFSTITLGFDFKLWKKLLKETYPMGLALIFYNVALRAPILMLDRIVKDESLTGMYGVAQRIIEVMIFIPIAFMNSVLPSVSRFIHEATESATEKLHKTIQHSFDFLNALSLPIIAGGIVVAPEIITVISAESFAKSHYIFQILISMIFFYYLSTFFGYLLFAYNKQMLYMKSNLIAAIATILCGGLLTYYLAKQNMGEYGALSAHILAELVSMTVSYYFLRKLLTKAISFKNLWRMILASGLMYVVLIYLKSIIQDHSAVFVLGVSVAVGSIVYVLALFLFKALPFKELREYIFKK